MNYFKLLFICLFLTLQAEKYSIDQFLNTTKIAGFSQSFDDKTVYFSSDESGIFNVYALNIETNKKTALTNSTKYSMFVVSAFPEDERLLFTYDEGGNERNHLYIWERDKEPVDLTPFPGARADFQGFSHDEKSLFFTCNARDPRSMDVYEVDLATLTPNLIFKNENYYSLDCVSRDKNLLALRKTVNRNASEIYIYDRQTEKLNSLFPKSTAIQYLAQEIVGDQLYYLTDKDSEFLYLKKVDLKTGKDELVEKADWDIVSVHFSRSGRYRITGINQDGKTVIRLYDTEKQMHIPLPKPNEGQISQFKLSPSETQFVAMIEGDRIPGDLYLTYIGDNHSKKLTQSLNPAINSRDLVEGEIIRFASYDSLSIPAFFLKPQGLKEGDKIPALIYVHGGPGGQSRAGYNYLLQYLVNQGYAVLLINNRGSQGYGKTFYQAADRRHGEADLDDCIASKKFLIGTGFIDPQKIGIIGGSYGGYMTLAALAFRPDEMAVGIDIFGVSNWIRTLLSIPAWWEGEREGLYQKIGHPVVDADYLKSISPLFHANKIKKPLLVIQGANDPRVLKVESDQIIEEVNKNGIPNRYVVFEDEGHGFLKKENKKTAALAIHDFLKSYMPVESK